MKKNPRKPDPLRAMSAEERADTMKSMMFDLFGEQNGAAIWQQMEPVLNTPLRQPGDDRDPQKNHWKGVWKIHEID